MNEKYNELIKDIACIIADAERENFLLRCELEETRAQLEKAEAYIACFENIQPAKEDEFNA